MNARKLAVDPLWQCLCPSWTAAPARRSISSSVSSTRPKLQCANVPRAIRPISKGNKIRLRGEEPRAYEPILNPLWNGPLPEQPKRATDYRGFRKESRLPTEAINFHEESTPSLYTHMRGAAIDGEWSLCRFIAEMLVKERGEKPNIQLYNTLILSNISPFQGAAWRVSDLLVELEQDGLQADVGTCHAVLKVLSVHVDHLLRTNVLDYMSKRWFQLTEDGAHDVAAGLLREGLFEQGLQRLDSMRREGMHMRPWLLDMAVYILCEANEIGEAHRLMRWRVDSKEPNMSRSLWMFFLDRASAMRHHVGTSLAWSTQVNTEYINPSSGMCMNVLSTCAQAADPEMATEVFTLLSKRGASFQSIHYELLINTYLAADPPDLRRALTILTIMALEDTPPSIYETRSLFLYLESRPELLPEAVSILRDLHDQGRTIPITALNLIIECYVHNHDLSGALNLYKQIHTFVPISQGAKKSFADIETFNLLLKGCHYQDPPEAHQASFLVSELLALRITPTSLTFDRLIITFAKAAKQTLESATRLADTSTRSTEETKGKELLDWAFRHFSDMQPLGWLPRYGTIRYLAVTLAETGDTRCWDVLQAGVDNAATIEGWQEKGSKHVRSDIEEAWRQGTLMRKEDVEGDGGAEGVGRAVAGNVT